jgi:4-diphosphocytidyl-2-C-methyl-D-erythritol kinase
MPAIERQVRVRAYAKVNLDLRVLWRRPDGYHEIRTLFHTISLADSVHFVWQGYSGRSGPRGFEVHTECPGLDLPATENLAHRAALAFGEAVGLRGRLQISIEKKIPAGGGLGGGSSNAAAVLLSLPSLTGRSLPCDTLMELASSLGSDVPFFLMGGAAVGLGRGEELYPLPDLAPLHGLLVAPGISVSTADAYRALARPPIDSSAESQSFAKLVRDFSGSFLASRDILAHWTGMQLGHNDFEPVVFAKHPEIARCKVRMADVGALHAMMSGSGSTVFGLFASKQAARRAQKEGSSREALALPNGVTHLFRLLSGTSYQQEWRRNLAPYAHTELWPPQSNSPQQHSTAIPSHG